MKQLGYILCALALCACKNEGEISVGPNQMLPPIANSHNKIVSSYVRNNFLETGRVSAESMNVCNDLIILGINPYPDGSLYFEIPDNSASFTGGTKVLAEFQGRDGVLSFDGTGKMNAGNDLLHTPAVWGNDNAGKYPQFTFGTWLFVTEWTQGACLFKKENTKNKIAFKEGDKPGEFVFEVDNRQVKLFASDFETGKWVHVALTYSSTANNKGTHLYINGKKVVSDLTSLTDKLPYVRTPMQVGSQVRAGMDEVFFNGLALSEGEISKIKDSGLAFSSWNMSKTLAYWKFDDEKNPGKDSHSWVDLLQRVRNEVAGSPVKIRAGITAGDWKTMCSKENYREDFAKNIKSLLEKYNFDGVDLDFEWPLNPDEFDNYSKTIVKLREVIGKEKILSVSLHPLYYKISQEAIKATDHISLQCYGPSPERFPYETYVKEAEAVVQYGISKDKLVLGLPFYGSEEHKQGTASYWDFVRDGLIIDNETDEVVYKGKKYIFNGQKTIAKKTRYVIEQNIAGIMSWDLATDVTISHPRSLLKSVMDELN